MYNYSNYFFSKTNIKKNLDIVFINLINIIFLLFFIFISPFDAECDATTNFGFAAGIAKLFFDMDINAAVSHRPFLYPLYVMFSGVFLFDSLKPIIFFNSILSVIACNYLYSTFRNFDKTMAFILTVLFLSGLFLYMHINSFFEMHLVLFFIIFSICSLINFKFEKKKKYFFYSIFSLFFCFLTRLDTLFIFVLGLIFLFFNIFKYMNFSEEEKKFYLKNLFLFTFIFAFFWAFYKSFLLYEFGSAADRKNKKLFFESFFSLSVNHFTGQQLFWRMNSLDRHVLNFKNKNSEILNVLDVKNGKYSKELYDVLIKIIHTDATKRIIKSYKPLIQSLGLYNTEEVWNIHYGEYITDPESIVDRIFSPDFESLHFPLQVPVLLKENIGTVPTDKLLLKVYYEFKEKHPHLNKNIFTDLVNAYGFKTMKNFFHFKFGNEATPNFFKFEKIWYDVKYNAGKCPENSFSSNMFNEYKRFNIKSENFEAEDILPKNSILSLNTNLIENVKYYVSNYRQIIRAILGVVSFMTIIFIFLFKEWILLLFINSSYFFSNLTASYFVSSNGKMTVYLLPLLFMNLFIILCIEFKRNKKKNLFK